MFQKHMDTAIHLKHCKSLEIQYDNNIELKTVVKCTVGII